MNIALTFRCNQHCPYCFGTDAMYLRPRSGKGRELSMADLDRVIAFLLVSRESRFNMIGGEPTQHSRFIQCFQRITAAGLSVMLFSNGVIDPAIVDFLKGEKALKNVLLNIRQPEEYRPRDWKYLVNTMQKLKDKVTLSFRVYRMEFQPTFLFDLIDRYRLTRLINWAIACPSLYRKNVFIPLEYHRQVVKKMSGYLGISQQRGIGWYSDSGFIRCAFSDREMERFRRMVGFVPETNCSAAIEVGPDLRVFRCFGMAVTSRPDLLLTDFPDRDHLYKYLQARSLPLKRVGSFPKCFTCEHMSSGVCCGGCMVHILRRMNWAKAKATLF